MTEQSIASGPELVSHGNYSNILVLNSRRSELPPGVEMYSYDMKHVYAGNDRLSGAYARHIDDATDS